MRKTNLIYPPQIIKYSACASLAHVFRKTSSHFRIFHSNKLLLQLKTEKALRSMFVLYFRAKNKKFCSEKRRTFRLVLFNCFCAMKEKSVFEVEPLSKPNLLSKLCSARRHTIRLNIYHQRKE